MGFSRDPSFTMKGAMKTEPGRSGSTVAAGSVLHLGIPGFQFADLFQPEGLRRLTETFETGVLATDPVLMSAWRDYRAPPPPVPPKKASDLLVRMAPHVSRFIARLFGVENDVKSILSATRGEEPLFRFKVDFLRRRV